MDNIQIGRLIYDKRKELGLTQAELADRLKITNKAVSKWENGDGMPDVNLLAPLASELGLTVDELLNGEEKAPYTEPQNNISETETYKSPLTVGSPAVEVKDAVLGIIVCAVAIYRAIGGFSSILSYLAFYSDKLVSALPDIALIVYNILFWALVSAVFICKLLRIFDIETDNIKSIAIATFIIGLPMLYIQGIGSSGLSYGSFFFLLSLLLSVCHGYKVPHKIFYGLAILATVIFGMGSLFEQNDFPRIFGEHGLTQFSISLMNFLRTLIFYILYGVFEKRCDEYEM